MVSSAPRVVLVGAGHASLQVLEGWRRGGAPAARLTLVSDRSHAFYSGMVPGWVAGEYERRDLAIALGPLAARAGAEFVCSAAERVEPESHRVVLADGRALDYDLALLDVGSVAAGMDVPGAREHALPARPIGRFIEGFARDDPGERVAIVGGGPGGAELALACSRRSAVTLVERGAELLASAPRSLAARVMRYCRERRIELRLGATIASVEAGLLALEGGDRIPFDRLIWATHAAPPPVVAASELPADPDGFVPVSDTLQVVGFDRLLAAGDAAAWSGARSLPKAGVYAVRAGPIALHNLRALLRGESLRPYRPQRDFLVLLNLADGTALGTRCGRTLRGRWVRRLKDRIDRRWLARFQ